MKKVIGFALFFIAVGMLIMLDAAKCLCWSCVDFYMSHSWI